MPIQIHYASAKEIAPLLTFGSSGSEPGQFAFPRGIAVDSLGNIYVADNDNFRIEKFNSQGTFLFSFSPTRTAGPTTGGTEGVAVDSSGNIYVTDKQNQRVEKYNSTGTLLLSFGPNGTDKSRFGGPQRVAIDSSGNIFVADTSSIYKFDSQGKVLFSFDTSKVTCCLKAWGIITDSSDNVYVADYGGNQRIVKFDSNGSYLSTIGSGNSTDGGLNVPVDVAVDNSGDIFVADTFGGDIVKFNSQGTFVSSFSISGLPGGIAIDKSGKIYVTSLHDDQVKVFSISQIDNNTTNFVSPKTPITPHENSTAPPHAIIGLIANSSTSQVPVPTGNLSSMVQSGNIGNSTKESLLNDTIQSQIKNSFPLKQVESGIVAKDVQCKDGYVLLFKPENGNPACVKPSSVTRLLAYGWVQK